MNALRGVTADHHQIKGRSEARVTGDHHVIC